MERITRATDLAAIRARDEAVIRHDARAAQPRFRPCAQCGLSPARHNGNLARIGDPAYAGHEYR